MALLLTLASAHADKLVVAYVPNWVDLKGVLGRPLIIAKLTHINVAFENPTNEQGDFSFNARESGADRQGADERRQSPRLHRRRRRRGQQAHCKARYFDLLNDAKRGAFVAKLAGYVVDHGFDGLDVDIEGPSINRGLRGLHQGSRRGC